MAIQVSAFSNEQAAINEASSRQGQWFVWSWSQSGGIMAWVVGDVVPAGAQDVSGPYGQVVTPGMGITGAGGGGGGGGGGTGAPGGAATAVQAGGAVFAGLAGGGGGLSPQRVRLSAVIRTRKGEFNGLETLAPDTHIGIDLTPHSVNWNSMERPGSLSVRRGCAKLYWDIDHADAQASPTDPPSTPLAGTYRGLSLCALEPTEHPGGGAMLVAYGIDGDIGDSQTVQLFIVDQEPGQANSSQNSLATAAAAAVTAGPAPVFTTISSASAGVINVAISHPTYHPGTVQIVGEAITIRLSSARFPQDIDGNDDDTTAVFFVDGSANTYDRLAITPGGNLSLKSMSGLVSATRYYFSVWFITRTGVSAPLHGSIVTA